MCQVFVANAYIKPDRILLVQDMTPIMASSNFKRWLKTPTENKVPGKLKKFVKNLHRPPLLYASSSDIGDLYGVFNLTLLINIQTFIIWDHWTFLFK